MEIRTIEDCLKLRLLRQIKPNNEKMKKSLELAKERIKQTKSALNANFFQYAIIEAYMTIFHAARALLYKDGIQEKSHYAIFVYIKERYSNRIPAYIINFLNIHRIERHEAMYGLEFEPRKEDAERAMIDAEIFLKEIEKVIQ